VPYRIDLPGAPAVLFDRLVDLGALDVEATADGVAALLPDSVSPASVAAALGANHVHIAPAHGRDDGSVWVLSRRPVRAGQLQIVPAGWPAGDGALRLVDGPAFGTGLHPTTALCLEIIADNVATRPPAAALDVGTGSGVLALAALHAGVPRAVAIDIDGDAIRVAAENARLNRLEARLRLVRGGPSSVSGQWPLVLANVLAAPLAAMAPELAQRVARRGQLVLSGIRSSLAVEVEQAYRRVGMQRVSERQRDGWSALTLQASW
jgi:ribosomal protein L11 methyltransferase